MITKQSTGVLHWDVFTSKRAALGRNLPAGTKD